MLRTKHGPSRKPVVLKHYMENAEIMAVLVL